MFVTMKKVHLVDRCYECGVSFPIPKKTLIVKNWIIQEFSVA